MADRKLTELERVQAKAKYNYQRRLREQQEEAEFRASLDAGVPTAELDEPQHGTIPYKEKKGK